MAKKFVRGVTDVKDIEKFNISLTNVNDIISDGQNSYIHTKKGESESYYNLTDNISSISSSNNDLIDVTTDNKTVTLIPKHDAQKEQVLESERNTVSIRHATNGTPEKTKVDTNPAKVLEHDNLIAGNNLTKTSSGNTTTLKVSDDFTNKVNKMDTTLNELKTEGLKPYKELGFNINDNIPELFTNFREQCWGGEGTVDNNDGVYSTTITSANQGMVTNMFSSTNSKIVVRLKGNVTVKNIGVHVQFVTTGGATTNKKLAIITGKTTLDETITFDPSLLAVDGAVKSDSFQIIINSVKVEPSDDPSGIITINTCSIKEADSLQLKETYDPNLRKFLNNMASNLETLSEESKNIKELGFNINDNIPELFTNFREQCWGGEGTVDNNDGVYSTTITSANQGMVTNMFSSTNSKIVVRLKGNVTVKNIGVHVQFVTTGGATTNKKLAIITGKTTLDETITFDPSSLAVYDSAKSDSFQIIINSVKVEQSDDPSGIITINTCSIKEADSLQLKETYDPNLRQFLNNMASNLETLSEESKNNSLTLTSPNNKKYRVLINESGELYTKLISFTKVLYMGNSILAGANTDGTHGRPFGLGATSKEQSLEYKLNKLLGISGEENSTLKHDAAFEQSENNSDAQQYINTLSECMTADTDLVIVQIADNVNNTLRYQTFTNNFDALIKKLQSINPNATILLAGAWYDSYQLTQWLSNYANTNGLLFTNLRALNIPKNQSKEGLTQTYDDGTTRLIKKEWETHTGDDGYTAMAQAIYNTLTN